MKKLIIFMLSIILILGAAACGGKDDNNDNGEIKQVSLRVWGSQADQIMLRELVDLFKEFNSEGYEWNITFGVVGENIAKNEVLKDVTAAADVFAFASDQIAELRAAGALYRVTRNRNSIIAANTAESIAAATIAGELFAYPASYDTFFLYYDKSIFSDTDVQSLESIMAKSTPAGTLNFGMPLNDGWYNSSFFFSAGCTLFGIDGYDINDCTFNSPDGFLAGKYMINLANNSKFQNLDVDNAVSRFKSRTLGAAVAGTWKADDIRLALGNDFGVRALPTITLEAGRTVNMKSMSNYKLYGVKSATAHPIEAMMLAEWLSGKFSQQVRLNDRSYVPTNLELINDTEAMSLNKAIAACLAQSQYSVLQSSIPQMTNFWVPAEAFGNGILSKEITINNLQTHLNTFTNSILATF